MKRLAGKGAALEAGQAVRLVPASGAASRMFKALASSNEEALKQLDKEIKSTVTAAAEFAQQSPEPDPEELYTDVLREA